MRVLMSGWLFGAGVGRARYGDCCSGKCLYLVVYLLLWEDDYS